MSADNATRKTPTLRTPQPDPLAARAFAHAVPDVIARIGEMTRATRKAMHESQNAMARRAEADGVRLSSSRLSRMERMGPRSELDFIGAGWIMASGGYRWSDVYAPLAGAAGLSDEETELLRAYRAAAPYARGSIVQYGQMMARETTRTAERPDNVHDLPRPAAHPDDALAREQARIEAQATVDEHIARIDERQQARKKRPRRFYGQNGTHGGNGHTGK